MASFDRNRILTGSPHKRLITNFNNLKNGQLTESAAKDHMAFYKDMPLSFIIENSRYIFSEPLYGLDFYKEAVIDHEYGLFTTYESEGEKLHDFILKNKHKMSPVQAAAYETVESKLLDKCNEIPSTLVMAEYARNTTGDSDFEKRFSDALYEYDKDPSQRTSDAVYNIVESVIDTSTFFTYVPYAAKVMDEHGEHGIMSSNLNRFVDTTMVESASVNDFADPMWWHTFVEASVFLNKLSADAPYMEALATIGGTAKPVVEFMMSDPKDFIDQLFTERVSFKDDTVDIDFAVNDLLQESFIDAEHDRNAASKKQRMMMEADYYNTVADVLVQEVTMVDDPSEVTVEGYSLFEDGLSLVDANIEIGRLLIEASDTDDDDEDEEEDLSEFDDIKDEMNNKTSSSASKVSGEGMGDNSSKKPKAPKADLITKVQTKAQDIESKELDLIGKARRTGRKLLNAGKSIAKIPGNIKNEITGVVRMWDKADDNRRKKYMSEPGFRKKIFKNIKLAILYGSTAAYKITALPFVMMVRKLSKSKDKRIRNELIREIQTEIDICEDKIQDASNNGDATAKHDLMRIKSQLEAELTRVKLNSKNI